MKKTNKWQGTSLKGHLTLPYERMVEVFGEPHSRGWDGDKTDVEWAFETSEGIVFTLYNWKNGKNYCGEFGLEVEKMTEWNIGGKRRRYESKCCNVEMVVDDIVNDALRVG